MTFPENDTAFQEYQIDKVSGDKAGEYQISHDGWWLMCGEHCVERPVAGQTARQYGRGLGATVRGLFIDGKRIWYRTEAEDQEYRDIQAYGADAADWLGRWDAGRGVWSISMGGLGPGYEQCIQITAAEMLRALLESKIDLDDESGRKQFNATLDERVGKLPVIEKLGLSGAQWGAASNLAAFIYKNGPRAMMADPVVKDRHIQVQKHFPQAAE